MKLQYTPQQILILAIFMISVIVPKATFAQYKWVTYTGDPQFMSLEDNIDQGRILFHKLARNSSSLAANRGFLFDVTLFAFPSLTGSFAWSQVRVNIGKISFYPHIFTFDRQTSTLAIAFMYNISRVAPVRGIRTRPSFSPISLLQLEKEKMNFSKLKFVSEGLTVDLILQAGNQETELNLSDFDVNYTYWLKSTPTQKETAELRTFFARPLTSFKIRAYSDKGYLDATFEGPRVKELSTIFVSSVDLYQTLLDPNYINAMKEKLAQQAATNSTAVQNTNAAVKPVAAPKATPKPAATTPKPATTRKRKAPTQKKVQRKVVRTNKRPQTTRVVRPR